MYITGRQTIQLFRRNEKDKNDENDENNRCVIKFDRKIDIVRESFAILIERSNLFIGRIKKKYSL